MIIFYSGGPGGKTRHVPECLIPNGAIMLSYYNHVRKKNKPCLRFELFIKNKRKERKKNEAQS